MSREDSSRLTAAAIGAVSSILASIATAAVLALSLGFPIPFAGIQRGLSAVAPALRTAIFYNSIGGCFVLGAFGGVIGASVARRSAPVMNAIFAGAVPGVVAAVVFAVLALFIGPW